MPANPMQCLSATSTPAGQSIPSIRHASDYILLPSGTRVNDVLRYTDVQKIVERIWVELGSGVAYGTKTFLNREEDKGDLDDGDADSRILALLAITSKHAGVKIVGSANENRANGLPRSQSTIQLLDKATFRLIGTINGTSISFFRTAAYSKKVLDIFRPGKLHMKMVLFGAGPTNELTILYLNALCPDRVGQMTVISNHEETSNALVDRLKDQVSFPLDAAANDKALSGIEFVQSATDSRSPVSELKFLAPNALTLLLGHDEMPSDYIDHVVHNGIVACDSIVDVSHRIVQSLPLFFSRQDRKLHEEAEALKIRNLSALKPLPEEEQSKPAHVTCVGLSVFDIGLAGHIFDNHPSCFNSAKYSD